MASCAYCNSTIFFGGKILGEFRFCNATCENNGHMVITANKIPLVVVTKYVKEIYNGNCPVCNGFGPVDAHSSHRIFSVLVMSSWNSQVAICCKRCGNKNKIKDIFFSLFLGWWGFPWGLLITPVQIGRNIYGIIFTSNSAGPSKTLEKILRIHLATEAEGKNFKLPIINSKI